MISLLGERVRFAWTLLGVTIVLWILSSSSAMAQGGAAGGGGGAGGAGAGGAGVGGAGVGGAAGTAVGQGLGGASNLGGQGHMGPFGMSGANTGTIGARPGMGGMNTAGGMTGAPGAAGMTGYGYGYPYGGPGYGYGGYGGSYGAGMYGPAYGRYGYGYGSPYTGGAGAAYAYWSQPRFWGGCGYPYYGGYGYGGYGYPNYSGGYAMSYPYPSYGGYGYGGYGYGGYPGYARPSTTVANPGTPTSPGYSSAYVSPGTGANNTGANGPYLGIDEEPVIDSGGVRGIRVTKVYPGSAAEKANLQVGDVIISINGYRTQERGNLAWIIANAAPNKTLTMNVHSVRDNQEHTITAQLP